MKKLAWLMMIPLINLCLMRIPHASFWHFLIPNYDHIWLFLLLSFSPISPLFLGFILSIQLHLVIIDRGLSFFLNRNLYLAADWPLLTDFNNFLIMSYGPYITIGCYLILAIAFLLSSYLISHLLLHLRSSLKKRNRPVEILLASLLLFPVCHHIHHHVFPNKSFLTRNLLIDMKVLNNQLNWESFQLSQKNSKHQFERIQKKPPINVPNIYLFIIESYGASSIINPNIKNTLREIETDFSHTHQSYSASVDSPVFGGQSWMAFASLNCGIKIDNQIKFKALFRSKLTCLPEYLKRMGYLTVEVKPGTKYPLLKEELNKYQFDKSIIAQDLDYKGKPLGWGGIPDEYTVGKVMIDLLPNLRDPRKGMFIEFFLVGSHTPWQTIVPTVGNFHEAIDDHGSIYNGLKTKNKKQYQAYISSLLYDLQIIRNAMDQVLSSTDLLIIIGDHPPNRQIPHHFNENRVPIHILSPRKLNMKISDFNKGIIPQANTRVMAMDRFSPMFIDILYSR